MKRISLKEMLILKAKINKHPLQPSDIKDYVKVLKTKSKPNAK